MSERAAARAEGSLQLRPGGPGQTTDPPEKPPAPTRQGAGDARTSGAWLLRGPASEGRGRAATPSLLPAGPPSGIKSNGAGRAQLYPCEQVNQRLSSV